MTVYAEGVDYAWSRPAVADLVKAGKTFACRYGGPGSSGKQLDAAEVKALTSHGIWIVANAEGAADGFVDAAAGVSWARQARDHFKALGMPANRPIYFSADFNAAAGDLTRIDTALRAAAGVIGAANVGVYGEYNVMRHVVAAKTAAWRWQTLAWSGGRWATDVNHIEQYRNAVGLGTAVLDLDRAVKQDYGQWGVTGGIDMPLDDTDLDAIEARAQKAARAAVMDVLFDGFAATRQTEDPYKSAGDAEQRAMRNVRDTLRGIVGGPVSQADILTAIGGVDEAVAAKLTDPGITAAEKANLLRAALGADAVAVGTLLAQPV